MDKTTLKRLMSREGYELDYDGQIVFYSGWFEHDDGTLSTEPQDGDDDEDEEEEE